MLSRRWQIESCRTPPTRSTVKSMDFGARMGRFNKWIMLLVYPFYLYLVRRSLGLVAIQRVLFSQRSRHFCAIKVEVPGPVRSLQVCRTCLSRQESILHRRTVGTGVHGLTCCVKTRMFCAHGVADSFIFSFVLNFMWRAAITWQDRVAFQPEVISVYPVGEE